MTEKAKIFKNTGTLMTMELGTRMLDIIISMIVARYLGPKGFGLLAFALSFGSLFSIIPGFGMGTLVIRDISRDKEQTSRYLIHGLIAKVILGLTMLTLMGVVSRMLGNELNKTILALTAGILVILEANLRFVTAFFQARQMMKWVAAFNLSVRIGWVIGSLTVMALHGKVIHLIGVRCFMNLITFTACIVLIHRVLQKIRWQWDWKFFRQMLINSFPFAMFRLFGTVYTDLDTVMLSAMKGDIMTGWYAAAQKFYRVITFIPASFAGTMLPMLSNLAKVSKTKYVSTLQTGCKYLVILAFPIVATGAVMSTEVTIFFYGKAFNEAASALRILMLAVPFAFLNEVLISAVASIDHEKKGSNILFMGLLFSGLSNFIVVPLFGHLGAAMTTGLAEAAVCVMQIRVLRKEVPDFKLLPVLMRPVLSAVVMAGTLLAVRPLGLGPAVAISMLVYLVGLFISGSLNSDDLYELKNIFSKKFRKKKSADTPPREGKVSVLFLETSMRIGGTETVVNQLIRRFDTSRFKPVLVCLYEPGELGEKLLKDGFTVYHGLAKKSWDLRIPFRLLKIMKKEKTDVVFIVNQPLTQVWGVLCSLLAGAKGRITAIRSTGKINRIHRRLFLNRLTFPFVERVTALSQMHKDYLVQEEGIHADQIEIIPNGVDLKRFEFNGQPERVREELKLKPEEPTAVIVAMLRPEKGHELFLRSAALVVKRVPNARFLIVGDGVERPKLEALTRELKLESRVTFMGARSDVPAVVSLCDVAVLSSRPVVETLSNAVLEYMAGAKPVISTRVGSVPEQIDEGKTGYLVEPGDVDAMADRMASLLLDRELARRMGKAAREKVEEKYTLAKMVGGTENLCERLANGEI